MKIINYTKKPDWNRFILERGQASFLESYEWGEFQERAGFRIFRFGIEDEGKLIAAFSLIKKPLGFGRAYFYCPKLVIKDWKSEIWDFYIKEIGQLTRKEKAIFLRFEPTGKVMNSSYQIPIVKTIDVQPGKTIILDLSKSEDELIAAMHPKTRYNIRLAGKKGVLVRQGGGEDDFNNFWRLMEETRERDGFRLHERAHYEAIIDKFPASNPGSEKIPESQISNPQLIFKLIVAECENKIIAGNIVAYFGDAATYVHGASANEFRNVMAPYLLQWETIRQAKRLGYKFYDFYGIDEKKWPGVTRFKRGFGGTEKQNPGTFDVVYDSMWYNVYRITRWVRRKI